MNQILQTHETDFTDSLLKSQVDVVEILKNLSLDNQSVLLISQDDYLLNYFSKYFSFLILKNSIEVDFEAVLKDSIADILFFRPEGNTYRVKEEVKEQILSEASMSPILGNKKVLILSSCQRLRSDSANSLLKSIEEPSKNIQFVLLANNQDDVIDTIKSRCVIVNIDSISNDMIKDYFRDKVEDNKVEKVLKYTSKNLGLTIDYIDNFFELLTIVEELKFVDPGMVLENSKLVYQAILSLSEKVEDNQKKQIVEYKENLEAMQLPKRNINALLKRMENVHLSQKRRIKRDALVRLCEMLSYLYPQNHRKISKYRKHLLYNPNEELFVQSLLMQLLSF